MHGRDSPSLTEGSRAETKGFYVLPAGTWNLPLTLSLLADSAGPSHGQQVSACSQSSPRHRPQSSPGSAISLPRIAVTGGAGAIG